MCTRDMIVDGIEAMIVQHQDNRNNRGNNLRYAVLFEGEDKTSLLDLFKDDYGPEEHWVLVKQNE